MANHILKPNSYRDINFHGHRKQDYYIIKLVLHELQMNGVGTAKATVSIKFSKFSFSNIASHRPYRAQNVDPISSRI